MEPKSVLVGSEFRMMPTFQDYYQDSAVVRALAWALVLRRQILDVGF